MMEWRGHPSFLSPGPWLGSCSGLRALEWRSGERFTGDAEWQEGVGEPRDAGSSGSHSSRWGHYPTCVPDGSPHARGLGK